MSSASPARLCLFPGTRLFPLVFWFVLSFHITFCISLTLPFVACHCIVCTLIFRTLDFGFFTLDIGSLRRAVCFTTGACAFNTILCPNGANREIHRLFKVWLESTGHFKIKIKNVDCGCGQIGGGVTPHFCFYHYFALASSYLANIHFNLHQKTVPYKCNIYLSLLYMNVALFLKIYPQNAWGLTEIEWAIPKAVRDGFINCWLWCLHGICWPEQTKRTALATSVSGGHQWLKIRVGLLKQMQTTWKFDFIFKVFVAGTWPL